MTTFRTGLSAGIPPVVFAVCVLARTTLGLIVHGLRRPGAPAEINRLTGKVAPR
jgi:hypothetical protein